MHPNQERVYAERGMTRKEWLLQQITEQANSPEAIAYWKQFLINGRPPIDRVKIR